jgi:hypothetical protein
MGARLLFVATALAAASCAGTRPEGPNPDGRPRSDLPALGWSEGGARKEGPPPSGKACVASCSTVADCPAGYVACTAAKCVQCKVDKDCAVTYAGACNTATGLCRFCASDAQCAIGPVKMMTGKCSASTGTCVACSTNADCAFFDSTFRVCKHDVCVQCETDADCSGQPMKGCDLPSGTCSRCTSSAECCPAKGGCGLSCVAGRCQCETAEQCAAAYGGTLRWSCTPLK